MISGEVTFVGSGTIEAQSAKASIMSGEEKYRITLPDLLCRSLYGEIAVRGVTLADSLGKGIQLWAGDVGALVTGYVQTSYAAQASGYRRFLCVPAHNEESSSEWSMKDESSRELLATVSDPAHLDLTSPLMDRLFAARIRPALHKFDLLGFLNGLSLDIATHGKVSAAQAWTAVVDGYAHTLKLWLTSQGGNSLPDFLSTNGLNGNSTLAAAWQFRSLLTD